MSHKQFIKFAFVCAIGLTVAACPGPERRAQIRKATPAEVAKATDRDLCYIIEDDKEKTPRNVLAELKARNLGDCTEAHKKCVGYGFTLGTPQYSNCRVEMAKADAIKEAASEISDSVRASSRAANRSVSCTTTGWGMYATTTCY